MRGPTNSRAHKSDPVMATCMRQHEFGSLVTRAFDHDGLERGVIYPDGATFELGETDSEGQVSVFAVFDPDGAISDR